MKHTQNIYSSTMKINVLGGRRQLSSSMATGKQQQSLIANPSISKETSHYQVKEGKQAQSVNKKRTRVNFAAAKTI